MTVGDGARSINMVTGYLVARMVVNRSWAPTDARRMLTPDPVRPRNGVAEKTKGGVRPDHMAGENRNDKPSPTRIGSVRLGDDHDVSNDATLRKAVELLRASPKKA